MNALIQDEKDRELSKKLFYEIRNKCGIDAYLAMKKMAICVLYAKKRDKDTGRNLWIPYKAFLIRNLERLKEPLPLKRDSTFWYSLNGCSKWNDGFFGVSSNVIMKGTFQDVLTHAQYYLNTGGMMTSRYTW